MPTTPTEPPGRNLLEGQHVVVTAAAGTGIGGALARRVLLEGGRLVISDAHERRLGETADALAEEFGTRPPRSPATSPPRTTSSGSCRPRSTSSATSTCG